MDKETLKNIFARYEAELKHPPVIGLVGYGCFGQLIRTAAMECGCTVLINDPPKETEESEEEYRDTMVQWGNGMGGCCTVREDAVVYLPLSSLTKRADLLVFAVPPDAEKIITPALLASMKPDAQILNFSGEKILSPGLKQSRIH